jgi:4-amino-4-deoxy-L-arabinose transferase-like glycosyltransferase
VLVVQAVLSLRLVWSNTAFTDEALYLWAGHLEWAHWLHGSALPPSFPTYFSGAPVVYPPLGAAMADLGGLAAARLLSLFFILTASVLLYATASRMFGRLAGFFAAGVFAATGSVQFLGAFATYDAMALMLLALATWLSVVAASRSMAAQVPLSLLAGLILSVADAAKYAAALWDPIVICVVFLAAWRAGGWRRAAAGAGSLLIGLAAAVATALKVGGPEYWRGIEFTTLGRQHGDSSAYGIAWDSAGWVGIVIGLAVIGSVVVARRRAGAATRLMAWALTFGAVLAPANQARIHVFTSLFKHVGFGSWFAAIMAGVALAALADAVPRVKRLAAFRVGSAAVVSAAIIGALLAGNQFRMWPASSSLTSVVNSALAADPGPVFAADSANVLEYYIADPAPGVAFYGQWYFQYQDPASRKYLVDGPAFADAIKHRFFTVITLSFGDKRGINQEITADIKRYGGYKTVTVPSAQAAAWHVTYRAWVRVGGAK